MADRIGAIAAPTLILFGRQDRLINPSAAETFHERIAGSEVVLLDGIGHLLMEEAPDATAAAIADFLKRRLVASPDRKSVGSGKSVSVRVDLVGRRIIKKTKHHVQLE